MSGYESIVRSELLPRFGEEPLEAIRPAFIESWLGSMTQAPSTRIKALVLMHGISQRARKVWGLAANPVADVERPSLTRSGEVPGRRAPPLSEDVREDLMRARHRLGKLLLR